MGTLSYTATVSLDGYAAGPDGDFQFGAPTAEVFDVHVARMGDISTEILGRRTHGLMTYWEGDDETWGEAEREFARRWCEIELVVASSTLTPEEVASDRARLVADLGLEEIREIVERAPREVEIFGPTTAAPALRAGMVRDLRLFVVPVILGGGLRALPGDLHLDLTLIEQRAFEGGMVLLHYRAS